MICRNKFLKHLDGDKYYVSLCKDLCGLNGQVNETESNDNVNHILFHTFGRG